MTQLAERLITEAVREREILRHWFDRMWDKQSFDGKFRGWEISPDAWDLMVRRGYIKRMRPHVTGEDPRRKLDRGTWALDGSDVWVADYELTPKGVQAARATAT